MYICSSPLLYRPSQYCYNCTVCTVRCGMYVLFTGVVVLGGNSSGVLHFVPVLFTTAVFLTHCDGSVLWVNGEYHQKSCSVIS